MADQSGVCVKSLNDYINWVDQLDGEEYLFRGVPDNKYKIQASACRRLPDEERESLESLVQLNRALIHKARLLGHDQADGRDLSDLELLAQLQHFGAATCLIDFTYNALVALWIACQQSKPRPGKPQKETNGKVVAIRSNNLRRIEPVSHDKIKNWNIAQFFESQKAGQPHLYQWQPENRNDRILAQHSVFVFGPGEIPVEEESVISKNAKKELLTSLDKVSNISEATLFPDFHGFVRLNAEENKYTTETAAHDFMRFGSAAMQEESEQQYRLPSTLETKKPPLKGDEPETR